MRRKGLGIVTVLGIVIGIVIGGVSERSAQTATGAEKEPSARIDRFLQQYVDSQRVAGVVALVLRDGKPVYERALGWSDREAGRKMAVNTIFRIASETKLFTSVAALSLIAEGKLALDDPVSRYIPAYAKTTVAVRTDSGLRIVAAKRLITVFDLMTHTAGISYGTDSAVAALYVENGFGTAAGFYWYLSDKDETACEAATRLATLPFVAQPGERWVFGYSVDVLGCVVERAAGVPLDQLIRSRITAPLRLTDTFFWLPETDRDRFAAVYAIAADGELVRAPDGPRGQGDFVTGPKRELSGGAGMLSTARDMAAFLEMIRHGGALGGVRVLPSPSVRLMMSNQVGALYPVSGQGFGLGFETTERFGASGLAWEGAVTWRGAYGVWCRIDPHARLTMVLMVQLLPYRSDIRERFPTVVYQALGTPR
jgi:CubicO group peptidase (beta-lactamase class C family)